MTQVRIRRLLLWVALPALLLVLLYTVLGFYVVPRLLRSGVHDFVSKNYHREVAIGDIRFNPYTLRLDIRDLSFPDTDGKPMLSFEHLLADLTVASIWRLGPDFEAIVLEKPFARVLVKADGGLNLSELALPPSPDAKPAPPDAKPARLFIKHFSVTGGNVAFEDLAHPSPFRTEIQPISFDLRDFATVGKDVGKYTLEGRSEAGERFSWTGTLDTHPLTSHGQFEVANLQARTVWKFMRDSVLFELPSGAISIAGEYDFTAATSPVGLGVVVHDVTVTDLGVRPKGAPDVYIKLTRLEVHEARADLAKRTVDVGSVRLAGADLRAWVPGAGGVPVNFMELVGAAGATAAPGASASQGTGNAAVTSPQGAGSDAAAPGATNTAAAASPVDAGWVVSVPDIAIDGVKIAAEDRSMSPAVPVQLDDLGMHITGFATSHATPVAVAISTKINHGGKLIGKADLTPDLTGLAGEAELANLDLTVLQPYIGKQTAMTLRSGLLSTKLNFERAADGHTAIAGDANVAKLRTVDNELKRDFIKFDDLQITGIDYQGTPISVPATAPGPLTARSGTVASAPATASRSPSTAPSTLAAPLTSPGPSPSTARLPGPTRSAALTPLPPPPPSLVKPSSLHIKKITARGPYARVIIESDRSVNVSRVLSGPNGANATSAKSSAAGVADAVANVSPGSPDTGQPNAAIAVGKVPPPADGSAPSATVTGGNGSAATAVTAGSASAAAATADSGSGTAVTAGKGSAAAATAGNASAAAVTAGTGSGVGPTAGTTPTASTGPTANTTAKPKRTKHHAGNPPPAAAPEKDGAMAITIDAIYLQDGSANYADLWIQPHFAVGIQTLNGSVLGLSSNPRSHAKVELKGKVDRYAPVHIWGEVNPFAATTYSDIRMNFKGVELTSATPYSGHFAGYKIEKGKLSVDIDYKIENRQLMATHKFVMDQLELGERVESPDAVHLPLKIAVALLKDRNGVIDIDLPVTGSLDDPEFSLGPLIWKAVLNLLTKIATAPFAMLGHLFGGGEQMNYIDFHPGSAVLDPSEHDKLVALVKALKEKDKLELDVPVTFSPEVDRPGLAAAHLNQRLLELNEQKTGGGRKRGKSAKSNTNTIADHFTANGPAPAAAAVGTVPAGSMANAPAGGSNAAGAVGIQEALHSPLSSIIDTPPPDDSALTDPEQRYHLLVSLYEADMGKNSPLPEQAQAIEKAGKKKDQPPPDYGAANAELEAALMQKAPVPDNELEVLGKHRARAIQDVLLTGTDLDPARVFVIGSAPKSAPEKDKVRVELALK